MYVRLALQAAKIIDNVNEFVGNLAGWLVVALVALTLYDVAMRYVLQSGSVAAQELEWHLFALIILLGAGYTLKHDEHVRVDLLYANSRFTVRHRAIVDLVGNLCFLLPFAVLIIWSSVPFTYNSFIGAEVSPDPGGLSNRWLLKAAIPFGFVLLALQAIANSCRALIALNGDR